MSCNISVFFIFVFRIHIYPLLCTLFISLYVYPLSLLSPIWSLSSFCFLSHIVISSPTFISPFHLPLPSSPHSKAHILLSHPSLPPLRDHTCHLEHLCMHLVSHRSSHDKRIDRQCFWQCSSLIMVVPLTSSAHRTTSRVH